MPVEITPEPDEGEHKAILAALAAEEAGQQPVTSAWAAKLLPARGDEEPEP